MRRASVCFASAQGASTAGVALQHGRKVMLLAAFAPLTPEQRRLRAQIAANTRWANDDPKAGTRHARAGFEARFERQVDPDGVLDPKERRRRAHAALKAHMARLAFASSKARARKAGR